MEGRKLDSGNPNPGNIGSYFGRLGVYIWDEIGRNDRRNADRRAKLEELNHWRNAIAHQRFDPAVLGGRTTLGLQQVRGWRLACQGLAFALDAVVAAHLTKLCGNAPW